MFIYRKIRGFLHRYLSLEESFGVVVKEGGAGVAKVDYGTEYEKYPPNSVQATGKGQHLHH